MNHSTKVFFVGGIGYSLLFYEQFVSIFVWLYCFFSSAWARDDMVQTTLDVITRDYLWEYTPQEALISSAEQLEAVIPWLIVEYEDDAIQLIHGEKGRFAMLPLSSQSIDVLSEMIAIEQAVFDSGFKVEADIDVDVELLRGYMKALDRYSTVMNKDSLLRFNERIQGQLTGIGCRVQKLDDGIRIAEVFPESPAYKGGILKDDIITHIDGSSIQGFSLSDAVDRLRGPINSRVQLTFMRAEEESTVSLKRAKVRIPNVRLYMEEDVAQIVIENFSSQTSRGVEQALKEIRNTKGVRGIILDLRGNTGGSMWQACRTVDAFMKEGLVLRTVGKNGKRVPRLMKSYEAEEENELALAMVVLINSRSASASEIVAGALKLHKRALLIGQKTHGKGVVQMPHTVRPKPDPVKIKLTVAQYLLHNDFSVHEEKGILPDVWLERYYFSEEGFSHDRYVPPDFQDPVLLYTHEESGWRAGGILREDYPLQFARKVLQNTLGITKDDLVNSVASIHRKEQSFENERMEQIFSARDINWQAEGVRDLEHVVVSAIQEKEVLVGRPYRWELELYNPTDHAIPQLYASFSAISEYMPWSDEQIPVGLLKPGERTTIVLEGEIPIGLSSSTEEIGIALHSGSATHSVRTHNIQIVEQSTPKLLVRAQIIPGTPMLMDVSVENLSTRAVQNIDVRLSLPNIKGVENLGTSTLEQAVLEKGDVTAIQYQFRSTKDIAQLPELKLEVQAEYRSSKVQYIESPLNFLAEQLILAPIIHTSIPTTIKKETFSVLVQAEDDGSIVETSLWLDGDKKGWRGEYSDWSIPLSLSSGRHRIDIVAVDDQGLESRNIYYVDVVP